MRERNGRPVWAPRLPQSLVRRLYEQDARGLLDDALIEELAFGLWERCSDIMTVTRAHAGQAACPRCRATMRHAWQRDEVLRCTCGWELPWATYHETYRRRGLHGGAASPFFQEYLDAFPTTRTPRERMVLIDRLVHQFHWAAALNRPGRAAAVNLIEGTLSEVVAFLDALSAGPERRATLDAWRGELAMDVWRRPERPPGR